MPNMFCSPGVRPTKSINPEPKLESLLATSSGYCLVRMQKAANRYDNTFVVCRISLFHVNPITGIVYEPYRMFAIDFMGIVTRLIRHIQLSTDDTYIKDSVSNTIFDSLISNPCTYPCVQTIRTSNSKEFVSL
jgi:hypothetical protein